jgi:two-component system, OmpR family, response regulator RegX3
VRVMLVGQDTEFSDELSRHLADHGLVSTAVINGTAALDKCESGEVDIILLCLNLPDMDGLEVCRLIRSISSVPIIILGDQDDEFNIALSLRLGADDYVVRPPRLRELMARMAAVCRRYHMAARQHMVARRQAPPGNPREIGDLRIDMPRRQVAVAGKEIMLTRKEFDLLALLTSRPGHAFKREHIMTEVWGYNFGNSRTLDVHIVNLRKKLKQAVRIETLRGVGFRLM